MELAPLSAIEFRPWLSGAAMTALAIANRTNRMTQPGIVGHAVMQISHAVCFGLLLGLSMSLFAADAHGASGSDKTAAKPPPATPAAPKPGGATIYFIRGPGIKGFWVPEVLVDDKKIGDLLPATVLTVSRPAGHHTIDLPNHIVSGSVHSEIDLTAGQTYYLEWGPYQDAPGMQLIQSLLAGGAGARGTLLPGKGLANVRFYLLDAEVGRELIAKIKNAAH
jgi:hypothetical protein